MRHWSVLKAAAGVIAMLLTSSPSAHAYGGHHGGYHGGHYRYGYHGGYGHYHRPYYYGHGGHGPLYSPLSLPATLAYHILKIPAYVLAGPHVSGGYYYDPSGSAGRHRPRRPGADETPAQPRKNGSNEPEREGGARAPDSASWDALVVGRYRDALHSFANEAQANPHKGRPKVGYALAAAAGGDLERGIWAMKRALQYDAEALHYLQGDINLESTVDDLVGRYQARMNMGPSGQGPDPDAGFMVASLHYLGGDLDAARQTVEQARRYVSTDDLARLDNLISQHEPRGRADAPQPSGSQDGVAIAGHQSP